MPHVFISYSTKNKTIAERLCVLLEKSDIICWIAPRDIPPGYAWAESIIAAIHESRLMIAVVSKDSCGSEHMAHELEGAETSSVPILPIRLDETPLTGQFQYFLGNKQWLDLRVGSANDQESAVVGAVQRLQRHQDEPPAADERIKPALSLRPGRGTLRPAYRAGPVPAVQPVVDELRDVIKAFVMGVMKRENALADFDLANSRTLFFAFRVLIYVSVASAIIHIPGWSAQGILFGHPAFLPLAVTADLIEQIAFCFSLYAAIRLFGGTADPQQFFCAFCLLGAYLLISNVCLIHFQIPAMRVQNDDIEQFFAGAAAMGSGRSIAGLTLLLVAGVSSFAFRIVFVLALFRAFHITNQLGLTRTALSFVCGIGMWILSVLVISQPLEANLYAAFRRV